VGDIDNDGDIDVFQAAGGYGKDPFRSLLLLNLEEGQFLDVTEAVGLSALGVQQTWGAGLADIDNDGDLDLLTATPHFFFLNDGDGIFVDATERSGLSRVDLHLTFIDYDLDGFVDAISNRDRANESKGGGLYRNLANDNHWLRVELVGVESNRNGIGTRVVATSGDLRQMREILGGNGRNLEEPLAHFGLGERDQVDELEIRWPSGQVDVLTDIPADQKIRIIEGRGEYHAVHPTVWESAPPDSLVAGSAVDLNLAIHPALFEPNAEIISVTADLSELGGPEAVPLADAGDGTYRLEPVSFAVEPPRGLKPISIMIDQSTSLGPHWTRLSRTLTVLPGEDLMLFGDGLLEGWELIPKLKAELDVEAKAQVHQGSKALGVRPDGNWRMTCRPVEPLNLTGYDAFRFAFHPGDVGGTALELVLGSSRMNLLSEDPADIRVDLEDRSWQVIEIPLTSAELSGALSGLIFSGRLEGTFYLDGLRLVAAEPPPSSTAVLEQHSPTLPQSFTLSQNYPNPFNSATVIRYALPTTADVDLAIFNLAGQRVGTLVEGAREAGTYTVFWDGRDDDGRALASGIYLYRLQTGNGQQVETRKLVLVR